MSQKSSLMKTPQYVPCVLTSDSRPEEGLIVLFPSFFFHRTIPFESAEERISVAFDVLREA